MNTIGNPITPELVAYNGVTTADGNNGGTTLIDANIPSNLVNRQIVILSGVRQGEMQGLTSIVTGTVTLNTGGAKIVKGVQYCILNQTLPSIPAVDLTPVTAKTNLIPADIGTQLDTNIPAIKAVTDTLVQLKQAQFKVPHPALYVAVITIPAIAADIALGGWTIAGIPAGMTVKHLFIHTIFGERSDTSGSVNNLSGTQALKCQLNGAGAFYNFLMFAGGEYSTLASTQMGGDAKAGTYDITGDFVPVNGDTVTLKWASALSAGASLIFSECEFILEVTVG